jgi:hypothetical protein
MASTKKSRGYVVTLHALHVREVIRWTELNEYEGEVHGVLDGMPASCYMLATPVELWDAFRPGATVRVDAWVESMSGRSRDVRVLPEGSPAELTQVDGVMYDVVGVITQRDGELLHVESVMPIRVDLDVSARTELPELRAGDVVSVRGIMKIELPDHDMDP